MQRPEYNNGVTWIPWGNSVPYPMILVNAAIDVGQATTSPPLWRVPAPAPAPGFFSPVLFNGNIDNLGADYLS
jgi:hypothetical protein